MEKIKCTYPGCKKEQEYKHNFELIDEEDSSVDLGFCKYHFYIVMGGHFKAKTIKVTKQISDFGLIGPLHEVKIAEQVMGAREMVAALTSKETKEKLKKTNKSTDLEVQTAYETGIRMGKRIIKEKI